jgi:hypothetical protein
MAHLDAHQARRVGYFSQSEIDADSRTERYLLARTVRKSAATGAWDEFILVAIAQNLRGRAIVLHIDPDREPDRARRAFESHLAHAGWMTREGYQHLLRRRWPRSAGRLWKGCRIHITEGVRFRYQNTAQLFALVVEGARIWMSSGRLLPAAQPA